MPLPSTPPTLVRQPSQHLTVRDVNMLWHIRKATRVETDRTKESLSLARRPDHTGAYLRLPLT
jgi:hypothetical protein